MSRCGPSRGEQGERWVVVGAKAGDPSLPTLASPESAGSAEGTQARKVLTDLDRREKPWRPVLSARWER